ncbi:hypothetical protein Agabi119p4_6736 [Agaricus bisporus var. burnettii]|uniref:Ricin B lectin domain-containing protein n=1 Tax=Agaricus bisporus var. burnettii TaxID=192524 RepID=A0A8H7CE45_AGABI|nr:hypothetical protein Agabi119p4_6736 [Agaricus bisporus var. burnettii]
MKLSYSSVLAFASIVAGQVMLHPNTAFNKCLEVRGDVRANGTAVQIFDCNRTPAQMWQLSLGPTSVRLANSDFCLDAGRTPLLGTPMKIWQCLENLPAQEWFLTSDDRIALVDRGLCLDLTNGNLTNTNVVQTFTCTDGNLNQVWLSG